MRARARARAGVRLQERVGLCSHHKVVRGDVREGAATAVVDLARVEVRVEVRVRVRIRARVKVRARARARV